MKTSLSTIKKELQHFSKVELTELCIRLAKYKKENKELLAYLLFDIHNESAFIIKVKEEADIMFDEMNTSSVYLIKKTTRKILRYINRFIKYAADSKIELELRLYFCNKMKSESLPMSKSLVLDNMYKREVERIVKAQAKLHEDLQFDYQEEIDNLG